jgi:hypothetical protein
MANMRKPVSRLFSVMKFLLPALYIAGAIGIWLDFSRSPPDGLANIWISIYTLPIDILCALLLRGGFPYTPGGYYVAHALYFWPSVALLAFSMFYVFHALQRR